MKKIPLLIVFVSLLLAASANYAEETSAEKIKKLQQERFDTGKSLLELCKVSFSRGISSTDQVMRAQEVMFDAKLDMALDKKARMEVFAEMRKSMDDLLAFIEGREKVGFLIKEDILKAKFERLGLEIRIEKEKAAQ